MATRIDGQTTADDMIASFQQAAADRSFDPSFDDLVVEGPECDLCLLSPNDLPQVIAAHDAALSAHPAYRAAPD